MHLNGSKAHLCFTTGHSLSLTQWKAKSIAPHMKQREAKWAVSMALHSVIAQLPGHLYSALPVLLFTALLVFVDAIE